MADVLPTCSRRRHRRCGRPWEKAKQKNQLERRISTWLVEDLELVTAMYWRAFWKALWKVGGTGQSKGERLRAYQNNALIGSLVVEIAIGRELQ